MADQRPSKGGRDSMYSFGWIVLCAPEWIVDLIREGYVIPFYSKPTTYTRTNQQSAWVNTGFVDLAVAELLSGGYVPTVSARPFAAHCQKKRLVLNLRHVNQLERKQKFKYEDMSIAMMLFRPAYWSIGLCAVYHSSLLCLTKMACTDSGPSPRLTDLVSQL
eukprot:Em0014g977a